MANDALARPILHIKQSKQQGQTENVLHVCITREFKSREVAQR